MSEILELKFGIGSVLTAKNERILVSMVKHNMNELANNDYTTEDPFLLPNMHIRSKENDCLTYRKMLSIIGSFSHRLNTWLSISVPEIGEY
jgi:hypothetical protein